MAAESVFGQTLGLAPLHLRTFFHCFTELPNYPMAQLLIIGILIPYLSPSPLEEALKEEEIAEFSSLLALLSPKKVDYKIWSIGQHGSFTVKSLSTLFLPPQWIKII